MNSQGNYSGRLRHVPRVRVDWVAPSDAGEDGNHYSHVLFIPLPQFSFADVVVVVVLLTVPVVLCGNSHSFFSSVFCSHLSPDSVTSTRPKPTRNMSHINPHHRRAALNRRAPIPLSDFFPDDPIAGGLTNGLNLPTGVLDPCE